jgi:mannose-1-phosphate guanylyltransferase / phosphomannomutase
VTDAMNAVIMAGGEGSRLRPLTSNMPKPMLPVANKPLMEHIVELLRRHGFTDVCATVQFLSSVIRNYFGDGSDLGVSLSYSVEDLPLGTAGSVLNARDLISGTFLVISGDALTDLDLHDAVRFHREKEAAATLVLKRMTDPLEFGIVLTDEDGRIERFLEKPGWGQVFSDTINTGIYILEEDVLDLIPTEQPYDFSAELFPLMLDKGLPLYGYVTDDYWTDVGTTDAFVQAQWDALDRDVRVDIPGFELRPDVWVGEDVEIHPSARVEGPAVIGDNTRIGPDCTVGPYAVVGDNVLIEDDARVRGIVLDRAHVGPLVQVREAVVSRAVSLERAATLEEGAVVGDDVGVGAGAVVKSRVKVYPSRTVEAGAIVTQSVVRERRASRSLFGSRGLAGIVNVGVTPMVAVRLGMAYGSTLKPGSIVVIGRDASRAARTMKRAVIAGLNAAGVTVHDLELTPMPLTRFTVRSQQAAGAISVRTSPAEPQVVEIRLFDADGVDLPEGDRRRIERIYFREDYRTAGPSKLGELEFPPHAPEQYVGGVLRTVDLAGIRAAGLKVVIDYAFGPACLVGPSIMGRLNCDVLSLNAYVDESRPVLAAPDLERMRSLLADHVVNSGSDLGVLLEPGGELAYVVDDRGRPVAEVAKLLAFVRHESSRGAGTLAVPVSAPRACEELTATGGARLQWIPTSLAELMARASQPEVGFAGNPDGILLFGDLMAAPDGVMTFCKTLELVASARRPLSAIVDDLPKVHMKQRDVPTPWEVKGAVMRRISSLSHRGRLVLIDGVKIVEDDRWALVIPYPDEPLTRVWAEAATTEDADAHAAHYADIVARVAREAAE